MFNNDLSRVLFVVGIRRVNSRMKEPDGRNSRSYCITASKMILSHNLISMNIDVVILELGRQELSDSATDCTFRPKKNPNEFQLSGIISEETVISRVL